MGDLPEQRPGDVTVLDMEASIEHLTRGTVSNVDALLVVTEPYYRSLETTGRIVPLALELGLERVWVVANKVRGETDETAIREYCARHGFEVIGVVPFDESVTAADQAGQALIDHAPSAPAVTAVAQVADVLTQRLGSTAGVSNGSRA
jgi:CO dehydrogenase maturation factor